MWRAILVALILSTSLVRCGKEDSKVAAPPVPPAPPPAPPPPPPGPGPAPCQPGQSCGNPIPAAIRNTYYGWLSNVNSSRAKKIGEAINGLCWGVGWPASPCPDFNQGYIYIQIVPNGGSSSHYVTINLGGSNYHRGVNLSGYATASSINNGAGTELRFRPNYTALEFAVVSPTVRLDGTQPSVPDIQINYTQGRPFANASIQSYRY